MSPEDARPGPPEEARPPRPASSPRFFRWQAVFQRTTDPLFVLDRRRRVLFVNRAWEELTGLSLERVRGLPCRQPRPASVHAPLEDVLGHVLTPPGEVRGGSVARSRRWFPGRPDCPAQRGWWDLEFFPLRQGGEQKGVLILGRVAALRPEEAPTLTPVPERVMALREKAVARLALDTVLFESTVPSVRRLAGQVRLVSSVRVPALLVGEPGTGKETLARLIHSQGPDRERSFAALDCRRLPAAFIARLLFGERSAAQRAALGTIYLKEPASLPPDVQERLAAWLTDRPAADQGPRLLAGTLKPLAAGSPPDALNPDLACLLGALVLEVPPLRERRDDLPRLVERLLPRCGPEGAVRSGLTSAAWEVFRAHPWPGNIRELMLVLAESATRSAGERIDLPDLPVPMRLVHAVAKTPGRPAERVLDLPRVLEQAEARLIQLALRKARGNRSRAAELLSLPRTRLLRRLEALGIQETAGQEGEESR